MVDVRDEVAGLLAGFDLSVVESSEFLAARFAAGLAWVHLPVGRGGLAIPREQQEAVDRLLADAGAPQPDISRNSIGLGMAAPTLVAFGTGVQQDAYLRPLYTGDEIWCQLFSEPGAGSDLAAVATKAVWDGDAWVVNGQKVWTSGAHNARRAIMLARTDPTATKHAGLTYFVVDMTDPGVHVQPLRQITGEAELTKYSSPTSECLTVTVSAMWEKDGALPR